MSRFFRAADSDSESSDDESFASSDGEQETQPIKPVAGRWQVDSDSDSDTGKRVVRSERDRRFDGMREIVKDITNHAKIDDWNQIVTDWEKLSKQVQKSQRFIDQEGYPKFYIKVLVELEDLVARTASAKQKLNKVVAKNFNRMQQNLKKHNRAFEKQIADCRAHPENYEEAESDVDDKDSDIDADVAPAPKPKVVVPAGVPAAASKWLKKPGADSSESDSTDEADWADDQSTEEETDSESGEWEEAGAKTRMSYWLRKGTDEDEKGVKKQEAAGKKVETVRKAAERKVDFVKPSEKKEVEWTPEVIRQKLRDLLAARGRKGTDKNAQIVQLKELLDRAADPVLKVEVLISLIAALFDSSSLSTHMSSALWRSCHDYISDVMMILTSLPDMSGQLASAQAALSIADQEETMEQRVLGNLASYVTRLHDELLRAWQFLELQTQDYIVRLQDELYLIALAERVRLLLLRANAMRQAASVSLVILEHLYYKKAMPVIPEAFHATPADKSVEEDSNVPLASSVVQPDENAKSDTTSALASRVHTLSVLIYQYGDERGKARAILCEVFHHSLQDRFYEARDMLLMSHLQDTIQNHDIPTMVLFNRTMTQLGLCAFRFGLINEAHSCLTEISGSGKVRELLAQGVNLGRYNDRSVEQEKIERRRLIPPHMHINLDLLEFVHLACAMLLEVPNMAFDQFDLRRRFISRPFRKLLDHYDRQIFIGPPEHTRDHIMAASRALARGEWQQCVDLIMKLPAWKLIPNEDNVREMLTRKIKEEGLRTYLFAYSTYYDTFSQEKLSKMFGLDANTVHAIVSKMMINEELHASWDQPTASIVMRKVEPTRLQSLALQVAEKAAAFVEANERCVDARNGVRRDDRREESRMFYDRGDRYQDQRRRAGQQTQQQYRTQTGMQRQVYGRAGQWTDRQDGSGFQRAGRVYRQSGQRQFTAQYQRAY